MSDGYVQVAPDSNGKKVDNSEFVRSDGITTVERQRVAIGDAEDGESATGKLAAVRGELGRGALVVDNDMLGRLASIDETLKEIAGLLKLALSA